MQRLNTRVGARRRSFSSSVLLEVRPDERVASDASAPMGGSSQYPWHREPPPGAVPLFGTDQVNNPGPAGNVVLLPGTLIQIPRGSIGVISSVQVFAEAPVLATRATWAILVNGVPAPNLGKLTDLFSAASSQRREFKDLGLITPEGANIQVSVTNLDGAARIYGAQLVGWRIDAQWAQSHRG
jgi:hypothetical protein